MVACLSCTLSLYPFLSSNNYTSRRFPKFGSKEALILLHNCNNFCHLKLIHANIIRNGLSTDQLLVRKLLHLCFSNGEIDYAARIFHQIQQPHTFTWNVMIRAYTINDRSLQALLLYNLMICQGFPPDKFTFPYVIKACLATCAIRKAKEVHGFAIKTGFSKDSFFYNTLINLYLRCGDEGYGCKMFDKMCARNVVSWTTMIAWLVSCGKMDAARDIFEEMPTRNVVSWTTMISGYVRNQQPEDAFELFRRMQLDSVRPNEFTLVSLLKACTELGSLNLGAWIHKYALKNGFELGVFLGTALIDMYSKCGSLKDAREVFDEIQFKSLATWNAMISSLGVHGFGYEALALFAKMEEADVQPDAITFVGVLCACVQINNVEEGERYFKCMVERYGITPISEHYSCMTELYNRACMSDEAFKPVDTEPMMLNNNTQAALIGPSTDDGISVKNGFEQDRELHSVGSLTCYLYQFQVQCYKWDVG